MAIHAPQATITLDKKRTLRFDMAAVEDFRGETGVDLAAGVSEEQAKELFGNLSNMVTLIWACLLHEDESLTRRQVARMLHPGAMEEMMEALERMMVEYYPDGEGQEENSSPGNAKRARRASKSSGPSGSTT